MFGNEGSVVCPSVDAVVSSAQNPDSNQRAQHLDDVVERQSYPTEAHGEAFGDVRRTGTGKLPVRIPVRSSPTKIAGYIFPKTFNQQSSQRQNRSSKKVFRGQKRSTYHPPQRAASIKPMTECIVEGRFLASFLNRGT